MSSIRRRWVAGVPYSDDSGARLEAARRFTRQLTAWGRASWHWRGYRRSTEPLDGPILDLSLGAVWLAATTVRIDAAFGYARERPKSLRSRNAGRWARFGVSVALPLGFTLGGGGEMRWTDYEGRWWPFTPDASARRDRTRIVRASVFNRALTVRGFGPQLSLVNETRRSNAQLHDYERSRVELRFLRQF